GERIAAEIRAAGGDAVFVETDVTRPESVRAALEATAKRFGGLNILYNNAGGSSAKDGPVTRTPPEVFWKTIELDLVGTWNCCHFGIPHLIKAGGGSVIALTIAVSASSCSRASGPA
ncbi:MAG TPA: SDR family NAD(P)-dependent oxidoreductase, partial [Xanthobacteraceae bacterium]|nr:SDR family NAD(P)-dependent oxidoreductase [Xanthobacteraceae bacterium]